MNVVGLEFGIINIDFISNVDMQSSGSKAGKKPFVNWTSDEKMNWNDNRQLRCDVEELIAGYNERNPSPDGSGEQSMSNFSPLILETYSRLLELNCT